MAIHFLANKKNVTDMSTVISLTEEHLCFLNDRRAPTSLEPLGLKDLGLDVSL